MKLLFVLGRTPDLAQKEIKAAATTLPFPSSFSILSRSAVLLKLDHIDFEGASEIYGSESQKYTELWQSIYYLQATLGGAIKIAVVLDEVTDRELSSYLIKTVAQIAELAGHKISYGISLVGEDANKGRDIFTVSKQLKKDSSLSLRSILPTKGYDLSSATVFHNKMALLKGDGQIQTKAIELNVCPVKGGNVVCLTLTVQDVQDYAERDFQIPCPDAHSGMLPPKLAQTMVNLAGKVEVIYDPFCGNGRIVEEAELMGHKVFGSDIVPKKIESAKKNLIWVRDRYRQEKQIDPEDLLWVADATTSEGRDQFLTKWDQDFAIVAEPFLGKPLHGPLESDQVDKWKGELVDLYDKFLQIWAAESRMQQMILVFPRAKTVKPNVEVSVYEDLVDRIAALGYDSTVLGCYQRPNSFVIREIVRIKYK